MHWLILSILALIGGLIFYQDFTKRSVTWILFPILAVTGLAYSFYSSPAIEMLVRNSGINLLFLLVQLLLLKFVYYLKSGTFLQLTGRYIGWGDILFLACSVFYFAPLNFILFYSSSLVFVLISHSISSGVFKKGLQTVPMAGWQAVFLFLYVFVNKIAENNLASDEWIIGYMIQQ